jgi:hypothetical protein
MRTLFVLAVTLSSSVAFAQTTDRGTETSPRATPAQAFELTLGSGYNQGFGDIDGSGLNLGDYARGGPGVRLGLGYRIDPRWMVGAYAEGARYMRRQNPEGDTRAWGGGMGIQGAYFIAPYSTINPWVGLGTGVRTYVLQRPNTDTSVAYGWDIVRASVGVEYRLTPSNSIGPMLGATITTFGARGDANAPEEIQDREPSTFVFVGMQGRFDIGGKLVSPSKTEVARR